MRELSTGASSPEASYFDLDALAETGVPNSACRKTTLLWVFADWCPVCHKEFHGLIKRQERFRDLDVAVATLECHDRYRSRLMVGKEFRPDCWFADELPSEHPHDPYSDEI